MGDREFGTDALFAELFTLYEQRLRVLENPVCGRCDAVVRQPLAVWHVGRNFADSRVRVLFVGKPHRGVPGVLRASGVIDPRSRVRGGLDVKPWAYWSYTRVIAERVFTDSSEPWEHVALTNLVKCTNVNDGGGTLDRTTETMVKCCVQELGVLSAEVALLKPTHLVFYTAGLFPEYAASLRISPDVAWRDVSRREVECGRKTIPWWEREARAPWCDRLRMLITGHPERLNQAAFTETVANWIIAR